MMYRLYGRIRLPIVQAWELEHDLDAFSCGPGKAAADTIWRQSIEAETAVALNGAAAAALLDMEKFYEMFNRTKLWLRGRQFGFNLTILRIALVAYSHARLVTLNGLAAESVWAMKGIIAGCSFARAIVRLYCLPLVSVTISRFPKAQFDFYIDDITVAMQVVDDDHAVSSVVDYPMLLNFWFHAFIRNLIVRWLLQKVRWLRLRSCWRVNFMHALAQS